MSCLPPACILVHGTSPLREAGQYQNKRKHKHVQLSISSCPFHGFGHCSTYQPDHWLIVC